MNEYFFQSTASDFADSHDDGGSASSEEPSTCAVVFGHFLSFGLAGQILFTFLVFHIPRSHHGTTRIPDSPGDALMSAALCLPVAFAIAGAVAARWKPINWLGHDGTIALVIVAIVLLGLFDLFMLAIWSFAGYC